MKLEAIKFLEENTQLTIIEVIKKIKKNIIIKDGNAENSEIVFSNVRVFYTHNKNFCGGIKNKFGDGFYISWSNKIGMCGSNLVKLTNNLIGSKDKNLLTFKI